MAAFTLSESIQYKISVVMVAVVVLFGIGGILFSSFSQPQAKAEVLGISQTFANSSSSLVSTAPSSENSVSSFSSSSQSVVSEVKSTVLNQTYSNPSYPNLLVRYPASWKFSTTTTRSNYEGLANRTLLLEKENSVLTININLATPVNCNSNGTVEQQKAFTNSLSRYTYSSNNSNQSNINFYYGVTNKFIAPCSYVENRLNSTILSEQFTNVMGGKQVYAQVEITLKSENLQLISEADSIIEALKTSVTQ